MERNEPGIPTRIRNVCKAATQPLRDIYMSWPVWFYVLNRKGRTLFLKNPVSLSPEQERILHDLNRDGIAISHTDQLFSEEALKELTDYAATLSPIEKKGGKKGFILEYWKPVPELSLENPFVRRALEPGTLAIINGYMRMWSKFYYFMLGKAIPVGETARASQRWHRDYEEIRMCKMFIYLSDVSEEEGPFMYVRGSNLGGKWRSLFPQRPGMGCYPPDGAVENAVPQEDIQVCVGRAGTVIFADTTGLHRGGFVRSGARVMFTAGYNSSAAFGRRLYRMSKDTASINTLPEVSRFALRALPFQDSST